jgi:hypothetical protein
MLFLKAARKTFVFGKGMALAMPCVAPERMKSPFYASFFRNLLHL